MKRFLSRPVTAIALCAIALVAIIGVGLVWMQGDAAAPEAPLGLANLGTADTGVDATAVFEGHLAFTAYHELGHALVSELGLPVLGKEEDAVDRLAIWILTPDDPKTGPDALIGSMLGWFRGAETTAYRDIAWWGEHSTDEQRAYQIACLLYGSDPERFARIAEQVNLPEERRESCQSEAAANDHAWATLLSPHVRKSSAPPRGGTVTVRYEPAAEFADAQATLRQSALLEDLAALIEQDFSLRPGIVIAGRRCDEANAYWDPEARELVMCYELVQVYQAMAESL